MDENVMHDVISYQNAPMMRFVMNVVSYAFLVLELRMSYFDLCSG